MPDPTPPVLRAVRCWVLEAVGIERRSAERDRGGLRGQAPRPAGSHVFLRSIIMVMESIGDSTNPKCA